MNGLGLTPRRICRARLSLVDPMGSFNGEGLKICIGYLEAGQVTLLRSTELQHRISPIVEDISLVSPVRELSPGTMYPMMINSEWFNTPNLLRPPMSNRNLGDSPVANSQGITLPLNTSWLSLLHQKTRWWIVCSQGGG